MMMLMVMIFQYSFVFKIIYLGGADSFYLLCLSVSVSRQPEAEAGKQVSCSLAGSLSSYPNTNIYIKAVLNLCKNR